MRTKTKKRNPCLPCNPSTKATRFLRVKRRNPEKDIIEEIEKSLIRSSERKAALNSNDWEDYEAFRNMVVDRFEEQNPSKIEVIKFLKTICTISENLQRDFTYGVL